MLAASDRPLTAMQIWTGLVYFTPRQIRVALDGMADVFETDEKPPRYRMRGLDEEPFAEMSDDGQD